MALKNYFVNAFLNDTQKNKKQNKTKQKHAES